VTLRKRLTEFSNTAVGSLTARELENPATDLEAFESADPPSFLRNRRADARELLGILSPEEQARSPSYHPSALRRRHSHLVITPQP